MKIQTIIRTVLVSSGFLFIAQSCEDKEELNLGDPSHSVVTTSEADFDNKVELNGEITFGDASVGIVSRTWSFPEGVADIVNSDNDVSSTESIVSAIFKRLGDHQITLNQTFKSDAYVGTELRGTQIDTTILVRVIDQVSVSVTANMVNNDGTLGDALVMANGAQNNILAGSTVRFSVTAGGEPENYIWTPEGGDPETSTELVDELDVKYKKLGTYDFSFAANRARPTGGAEISYSDLITVIPSTEPVTLDAVEEKDGNIGLNFSREMEPTSLNADDFSVSVTNGGSPVTTTIASVTVDPDEGNIVIIALDNDRIYNDDTVTVSYTAGGLTTTDAVAADSFAGQSVVFVGDNILAQNNWDYSFENSTNANWPDAGWGGIWAMFNFDVSTEQAYDGNASGLIEMDPNGGMVINHLDNTNTQVTFTVEASKSYEIGLWVYVDAVEAPDVADMFLPDLRFYWFPDTDWGVGPNPAFEMNNPDRPLKTWFYSSFITQFANDGDYTFTIRGFNEHNSTPTRVFIDNISVSEAVLRP